MILKGKVVDDNNQIFYCKNQFIGADYIYEEREQNDNHSTIVFENDLYVTKGAVYCYISYIMLGICLEGNWKEYI